MENYLSGCVETCFGGLEGRKTEKGHVILQIGGDDWEACGFVVRKGWVVACLPDSWLFKNDIWVR